ncbi:MAG: flippase [Bacteroidales bacterium]|nr:flippase [Bacteroidales bacterium]
MFTKIKLVINKIKGSKDGKTLVANFGYLSLLQVATYFFPLITMPYLARVIGPEGFGKIAFAAAIMVWFTTISDWGFNYSATRDVAKNRDDKEKVSEIFSNILWARLLLMVVSFVILSVFVILVPKLRENADIIYMTFLLIPGYIMFPDWFFQAIERMKYITVLNLISKTVFTIAIFIFIKEKSDYIIQPLLVAFGYLISGLIAMYYVLIKWKYKLYKPSLKEVFNTIKSSTDIFVNNLMPTFYNAFSTILLGFIGGDVANGLYEAGTKFTNMFQQFLGVLSRTFFPFLSRKIDKHAFYAKINVGTSVVFSLALIIIAPLLVKLFYTSEFVNATSVIRITSVSLIFLSIGNVYGTNYLIIINKEKQLRNITFISSIIGLALSFPLIYKYEVIGAALVVTLTRGILGIMTMWYAKKLKYKNQLKID